MNYENYKAARDRAWEILIETEVGELPVPVTKICRAIGAEYHSYASAAEIVRGLGLGDLMRQTDGFCIYLDGIPRIFYDETMPVPRRRFTLAHEIGHIALGHVTEGQYTPVNREPSPGDSAVETQANQFAARLLAPACVLHELGCLEAQQIAELCNISMAAARFRSERMTELERRQKYYLSPLERQVRDQFLPFLRQKSGSSGNSDSRFP